MYVIIIQLNIYNNNIYEYLFNNVSSFTYIFKNFILKYYALLTLFRLLKYN